MVKVENKEVLRELTHRFLRVNRRRNRIALLAIALTCLLFTTLFTGTVSIVLTKRAADIKAFQASSHAFAQDLTAEECERGMRALKDSRDVDAWGAGIFLGAVADRRLGFLAEVRCGDEKMAKSILSAPTVGRLPESGDEIALGTMTLDALGAPCELGALVTLTYERGPLETQTDTFRLSGYWESDKGTVSQMVWVSQDYAQAHAYPLTKEELGEGVRNGGRDLAVWYKNPWLLEKKTAKLSGDGKVDFQLNPAYDLMEEDAFSAGTVAALAALIVLAGYLIIYNVFSISVKSDLKVYGLLKNIGATGKQLKRIAYGQAARLALLGIPLGLLGGFFMGAALAPALNVDLDRALDGEKVPAAVSAHPCIFIISAFLTLLTVYLSVLRPCRLVGRVSPTEALRMSEGGISHRKTGRTGEIGGWAALAAQNARANWRKGLMVMFSIALSLLILDCIVMLVQGYDFEAYKKIVLASDFELDQLAATLENSNFDGITPDVKKRLKACPQDISIGYVYFERASLRMDGDFKEEWKRWSDFYKDIWEDYEKNLWRQTYEKGALPVHYMAVNQAVFEKLEWEGAACSWEEFQKGARALVNYGARYRWHPFSHRPANGKIRVELEGGAEKTYKIGGEAYLPYSMDYPFGELYAATVLLPETEFIQSAGKKSALYASVDCPQGDRKAVEDYLKSVLLENNPSVHLKSSLDLDESFQKIVSRYYIIGGMMAAALAFIGVMNFFNAVAASVISRKRELALLEAVGMTRSHLVKMLAAEGFLYLAGAEIIALALVGVCAEGLLERTLGKAFYFQAHAVWWPCLAPLPAFLAVIYGICRRQFGQMSQESVVERLRSN